MVEDKGTFLKRQLYVNIQFLTEKKDESGNLARVPRRPEIWIRDGKTPISATIRRTQSTHGEEASITIYGLDFDSIADITTLYWASARTGIDMNVITLSTPDGNQVFSGNISSAYADFNAMPHVPMVIHSFSSNYDLRRMIKTRSYEETTLSAVLRDICSEVNFVLDFQLNDEPLRKVTINGTVENAIKEVTQHLDCFFVLRGNRVLSIMKKGTPDIVQKAYDLGVENGLIGHPVVANMSALVRKIYSPGIKQWDFIRLLSPQFSFMDKQIFTVSTMTDHLGCNMPNAPWESELLLAFTTLGDK